MSKPLSGYTQVMELLQSESGWNRIRVRSISSNSQEEMQPEWYNLGATKFDRWFMVRDQVHGGGVIDCLDVRLQPMNISGSLPKDFVSPLLSTLNIKDSSISGKPQTHSRAHCEHAQAPFLTHFGTNRL